MKNVNIKKIIIVLVLVLLLSISLYLYFNKKSDSNSTESIYKDITVEDILFTNSNIIHEDGLYTYTVNIKNTGKNSKYINMIKFYFYDKDNKEIATLIGYVDKKLDNNQTDLITASCDSNIKDFDHLEIKILK